MDCFDKLEKLQENLTKRLGLDPDSCEDYVYGHFGESNISITRSIDLKELDPVEAPYNKNWTLGDWKAFRDRCLIGLRN